MATKLYTYDTKVNAIGIFRDLLTTPGSTFLSAVVDTVASNSTGIQWTRTAGGEVMEWISGRFPVGGATLSGAVTVNAWCVESATAANCQIGAYLYRRTAAGSEEAFFAAAADGVEFSAVSYTAMNFTITPGNKVFSEDDRLILRLSIGNIGTMGGGQTCSLGFGAGVTPDVNGDTWIQLTETIAFKAEGAAVNNQRLSLLGVGD